MFNIYHQNAELPPFFLKG